MALPGWDEIVSDPEFKNLDTGSQRKVFQQYLSDMGQTSEWKGLKAEEKTTVIRQMETDAGWYKEGEQPSFFRDVVKGTGEKVVKSLGRTGAATARALNRGLASTSKTLTDIGEAVGPGYGRSKVMDEVTQNYTDNAAYWDELSKSLGPAAPAEDIMGGIVGGAAPGLAEFAANIPFAALKGAAEAKQTGDNEYTGAATGITKRALLGQIFHAANLLKQPVNSIVQGAVMGGQAATEGGSRDEILEGIGAGLLFGGMSRGGDIGVKDIVRSARDLNAKVGNKDFVDPAKSAAEVKPQRAVSPEAQSILDAFEGGKKAPEVVPQAQAGKVIFLDLDGVVNTPKGQFNKENVEAVNAVLDAHPDAKIVVASTWRNLYSLPELNDLLTKQGIRPDRVIGKTGDLGGDTIVGDGIFKVPRGDEVVDWLKTHGKNTGAKQVLIIDDRGDYGPLTKYQVQPNPEVGFTVDEAGRAIKTLGGKAVGQAAGVPSAQPVTESPVGSAMAPAFAPAADFRQKPNSGATAGEVTRRSDIAKFLSDKFNAPIRTGKHRFGQALGVFKLIPEAIRLKYANDIETISHEVGHGIHKYLWPMAFSKTKGLRSEGTPLASFANELDPIASRSRNGDPTTEGFAEFIRLYVTNEPQARQAAPRFYDFFEQEIGRKSPESLEILRQARGQWNKWMDQSPLQRVLGTISKDGKQEPEYQTGILSRLYTAVFDKLNPVKKFMDAAGGEKQVSKNPYYLMRLLAGVSGKADVALLHQRYDPKTYEWQGKGLRQILEPVKDRLDEFRAYLVSMRALELAGRGIDSGVTRSDAIKIVQDYRAQFEGVAKELYDFQNWSLKLLVKNGVIRPDAYARMKDANRRYVPFYRVVEDGGSVGAGKGAESYDPTHKIKGSWRDIVDPLESVVKNTYLFVQLAERNAAMQALGNIAMKRQGLGKWMERVHTPTKTTNLGEAELLGILEKYGKWKETTQYKQTEQVLGEKISSVGDAAATPDAAGKVEKVAHEALVRRGFSESEAQQILDRIKGAKTPEAKTQVIEKTIERATVIQTVREFGLELDGETAQIFRPGDFGDNPNMIEVRYGGKPVFFQATPELARAIKGLDTETTNMIIKIMAIPARWLRAGATLSPEFIARNPIRDQFSAFVFNKGYLPVIDFTKGVFSLAHQTDAYWKWKLGGGEHAMLVSMDRDYLQKQLAEVVKTHDYKALLPYVKNPLEAMRVLSEYMEAGTRIGVAQKEFDKEGSLKENILRGAYKSREATLDFARMGSKMKAMNQITAFFNANLQGGDKAIRAFKDDPVGMTVRVLAGITIPSITLYLINREDGRWDDIPQWQKDLFWIIPTGHVGKDEWAKMTAEEKAQFNSQHMIVRVPKPFELGIIFGTSAERMVEFALSRDPKAFRDLAKAIGAGATPSMIPTAAAPIMENWANKSTFTGRPVVPSSRQGVKPEFQYQPYTTEAAKKLGAIIGKLPVIGETGAASPAKIENLVRGWTGGLGTLALKTADILGRKSGVLPDRVDPATTPVDIPYVKAFIVRYPASDAESIQRFYDSYTKASQTLTTARALIKEGNADKIPGLADGGDIVRLDSYKEALSNGNSVVQAVYNNKDMTPDEKRQIIDTVYFQMIAIAGEGNKVLDAIQVSIDANK